MSNEQAIEFVRRVNSADQEYINTHTSLSDKVLPIVSDPEVQSGLLAGAVIVKDLTSAVSNGAKKLFGNAGKVVTSEANAGSSSLVAEGEGTVVVGNRTKYIQFSGGKPAIISDVHSPEKVSFRTIENRNLYGYQEGGSYAGSFKRPEVDDQKLQNIVNDVYKGDKFSSYEGTGSTADAARWEYNSGGMLNGADHLNNKAPQVITRLEKWLKHNSSASLSDRHAAQEMLKDFRNAIDGKNNK